MYVGVDYYPEHWPRDRWEYDARLMQEAGFNIVRLAEFSWVMLEPEEGRFDFTWLDDALAILYRHGISAILGTPTAVMPAWLARKYPETLALQKDGTRTVWGVRKNNCFTSGAYRLFSERVTRAMTTHFAATPNVIGWQTDNEFGGPVCYCDTCRNTFQDWLRQKYSTLDELNRSWGTHFWGHTYGRWDEVQIPIDANTHNPSACLDWQRFYSWLNVRFQHDQVRILRQECPNHFITHNFMGLFSELNYYDLAKDLDFVSWDNYRVWGEPDIPYDAAMAADVMRGLKRKNFWIMEQTAGPSGWGVFGRNPRPGELRKFVYQQIAHGSDAQLWFRWRTCTAGREQYWHGLLGHDGVPARRYREAAQTARELHQLWPELAGTTVPTQVAMIYDYDTIWALRIQPGFADNSYHAALRRYYQALLRAGISVDIVNSEASLDQYKLVIAPELHVLPDETALRLNDYVEQGGVLFTDLRTGVKTATNLCHGRTLPGLLSAALGITIEEYESLSGNLEYPVQGQNGFSGAYTAIQYADWVIPRGATVLAGYTPWHMTQYAALTKHQYGKGTAYYAGAVIKEDAFYDALVSELLKASSVKPTVAPTYGVETSVRQGEGKTLLFLVNHTDTEKVVRVPEGRPELLQGQITGPQLTLGPFGVAVVKLG